MSAPIENRLVLPSIAVLCVAIAASATYAMMRPRTADRAVAIVEEGQPIGHRGLLPAAKLAPRTEAVAAADDAFKPVTFATLASYLYEGAEAPLGAKDRIPQPIRALNGMRVAVQGFMLPVDLKDGKAGTFMLLKDQSLCCNFGRMPRMNEWASVKMNGKPARVVMDQPVTVFGILEVGELYDKGELLSVYRIEALDVAGPLDL